MKIDLWIQKIIENPELLEGFRIFPYRQEDAEALLSFFKEKAVQKLYVPGPEMPPIQSLSELESLLAEWNSGTARLFTVWDETGLVMLLNTDEIDLGARSCEIGYALIDPKRRGQGLGTRVLQAWIERLFDAGKMDSLWARCIEGNEASIALLKALGFEQVGCLRKLLCREGQKLDLYLFQRFAQK